MTRKLAPFGLAAALLLLPLAATAADDDLLATAGKIGYGLRVAEKCGMPSDALERLSDALADVVAAEADQSGADRLALGKAVHAAVDRANNEFPGKPPLEVCTKVIADLESLT
ncbi:MULTISPECIES: hypothetical protein [unclassified Variovorax]|nr:MULTISPECIES: hypothetical protein [unclassified Variovorax]VTU42522.1 hypothetical protein H6P1_00212 [Variovorax sp. PBL-H6]VTU43871.1 hypothetical protein SRS16P1_00690 [Variovorax sp. SRS16]VTU43938.1 hypothetical protein E5P1_00683 [Variovorax sp. PBL-E5]